MRSPISTKMLDRTLGLVVLAVGLCSGLASPTAAEAKLALDDLRVGDALPGIGDVVSSTAEALVIERRLDDAERADLVRRGRAAPVLERWIIRRDSPRDEAHRFEPTR